VTAVVGETAGQAARAGAVDRAAESAAAAAAGGSPYIAAAVYNAAWAEAAKQKERLDAVGNIGDGVATKAGAYTRPLLDST
jgi:hypothetical protein